MSSKHKRIIKLTHHEQQEKCINRPPYRQGRKLTAVKVYTVNDESQHLLVFGVPKIKLKDELYILAVKFGDVKSLTVVEKYEQEEEFTETYHLHYKRLQSARFAKRQLDEKEFFGSILHVCYAPELESVSETRFKLILRRREVAMRIVANESESTSDYGKIKIPQRSKKHPALPLTEDRLTRCSRTSVETTSCSSNNNKIDMNTISVIGPMPPLVPSQNLLQVSNVAFTQTSHHYQNIATRSVDNRMLHPERNFNTFVAGNCHTPPVYNTAITTLNNRPLNDGEKKSLCFVPRQVKYSAVAIKKRIVFHNKS